MLQYPDHKELIQLIYSTKNLLFMGIFTAGMMVINLPMFSFKFKSLNLKDNWYRYFFIGIVLVLFLIFKVYGLAFAIFAYIILNVIFYLLKVEY
jgi:CDP-diacylglycerol--serine O-phosphatidyltransferase